jgi:acyl carrier protein
MEVSMDDVRDFVKTCINRILEDDSHGYDTEEEFLTNMGMDSVSNFQLMVQIESKYDIFFEDEEITEETFSTISNLVKIVSGKLGYD